jgi:excisionase family DNA binding protein
MAGMFYSLQEAAEKLNISEDQLKELAQEGKLREFRDGPNLLFKVDEVESLIPEFETVEPEVTEPETPEPEMAEPEIEDEEPVELDLTDTEVPEAEAPEPEPQAEDEEPIELDLSDFGVPEAALGTPDEEAPEPEAELTEPAVPEEEIPDLEAMEEEMPELEVSEEVPSAEELEEEMAGLEEPVDEVLEEELMPETMEAEEPEPEAPQPSESAADSDEILLAPETGAPLMSSDLTDADTALTGLGTNVLGETDQDYSITDDTMAETAIPTGPTGTTPEVPLEEIEGDVNLDTFGSGSGLLDLSLQADDTSLGGILDEIYTAEDEGKELGEAEGDSAAAMAADADQMIPEEGLAAAPIAPEMGVLAQPMIEVAPDSQSNTLGMLLFLPLVIVIYTTVVAIAGQRGVMPSILASIQAFIWYIMGGAAVVAGLVVVAAFMFTGERSTAAPREKKAKKVRVKKEKVKKEKKPKEPKKPKEKKSKKAKKGFLRLK